MYKVWSLPLMEKHWVKCINKGDYVWKDISKKILSLGYRLMNIFMNSSKQNKWATKLIKRKKTKKSI